MGRGDEIKTLAKLKLAAHDAFFPAELLRATVLAIWLAAMLEIVWLAGPAVG